jgi:hypothetical protein
MSPFELKILLHYYYSPEQYENFRTGIPLEFILSCCGQGVFRSTPNPDDGFMLTEKGQMWVESILATPMPIAKWCDARTGEVIGTVSSMEERGVQA